MPGPASTLLRNVAARPATVPLVQATKFAVRSREVSTSTVMFGLKESARDNEDRHIEVERHKQDILREQKEGRGHWKEALASDSESAIKADRDEVEPQAEIIIKLQEAEVGVGVGGEGGDGGSSKKPADRSGGERRGNVG